MTQAIQIRRIVNARSLDEREMYDFRPESPLEVGRDFGDPLAHIWVEGLERPICGRHVRHNPRRLCTYHVGDRTCRRCLHIWRKELAPIGAVQ